MQFEFLIDFGSFRDIQRHRSVIQRMPLLSDTFGMHPWYLESLPDDLRQKAEEFVRSQLLAIERQIPDEKFERQYYLPMGMCVPCRLTGDLPALMYLVDRRAQADVHPTLQEVAIGIADELLTQFNGLALHINREKGRFDVKRGLQDIVERR